MWYAPLFDLVPSSWQSLRSETHTRLRRGELEARRLPRPLMGSFKLPWIEASAASWFKVFTIPLPRFRGLDLYYLGLL